MKKTHIVLISIIAISIAAILGSLIDSSTYADFRKAFSNPDQEFHVVGELVRDMPITYDPQVNASLVEFTMRDSLGMQKKVLLHKSKPQDFERSEKIVLIGKAEGEDFHAREVLMKCPSKYNAEQTVSDNSKPAKQ